MLCPHLFQSDDELVDLNHIVVYSGCPVLFEQVKVTSGRACKYDDRGNHKSQCLKGCFSYYLSLKPVFQLSSLT